MSDEVKSDEHHHSFMPWQCIICFSTVSSRWYPGYSGSAKERVKCSRCFRRMTSSGYKKSAKIKLDIKHSPYAKPNQTRTISTSTPMTAEDDVSTTTTTTTP